MLRWRSSLTFKILALMLAVVVVPAVALFILSASLAESSLRGVIDEQVAHSLDASEKNLADSLYGLLELSARIVDDEEIRTVLRGGRDEIQRTRSLDRAVAALLLFFERREDIRYTIVDPRGRLFTNWSRNLEDYSFISSLPIARRAAQAAGHAVWEGFAPAYVKEEGRAGMRYVTVARTFPDFDSNGPRQPLLLLSLTDAAVGTILSEGMLGPRSMALIAGEGGSVLAEGGAWPEGEGSREELAAELVSARSLPDRASKGVSEGRMIEIASKRYLVSEREIVRLPQDLKDSGWRIIAAYEYAALGGGLSSFARGMLAAMAILIAVSLSFSLAVSRAVVKPVVDLARRMDGWRLEDGVGEESSSRPDEIGMLERSFYGMRENIRELFDSARREHEVKERYRIQALRSRLNPHFLFNSLNTVRFMAIINKADNIVDAIDAISTILQYAMSKEGDETSLAEELRNLESYLLIQNARFGGRFSLVKSGDSELLDALIPRFALQPAVENCVVHGYSDRFGSGQIRISAEADIGERRLRIRVSDSGRGIPAERLARIFDEPEAGRREAEDRGIGLPIVREMVRSSCGEDFDVRVESEEGKGTTVEYLLPLKRRSAP
jgi:Predicted signal transduction protein with a C-terminal ATPase domain